MGLAAGVPGDGELIAGRSPAVRRQNRLIQIPDDQERKSKGLSQGSRYAPKSAKHKSDNAGTNRCLQAVLK
jgi:hypothetical protein